METTSWYNILFWDFLFTYSGSLGHAGRPFILCDNCEGTWMRHVTLLSLSFLVCKLEGEAGGIQMASGCALQCLPPPQQGSTARILSCPLPASVMDTVAQATPLPACQGPRLHCGSLPNWTPRVCYDKQFIAPALLALHEILTRIQSALPYSCFLKTLVCFSYSHIQRHKMKIIHKTYFNM